MYAHASLADFVTFSVMAMRISAFFSQFVTAHLSKLWPVCSFFVRRQDTCVVTLVQCDRIITDSRRFIVINKAERYQTANLLPSPQSLQVHYFYRGNVCITPRASAAKWHI